LRNLAACPLPSSPAACKPAGERASVRADQAPLSVPHLQTSRRARGPPACKLAADSTFAVAKPARDAVGCPRYRLVSGSLPYSSGVRPFVPKFQTAAILAAQNGRQQHSTARWGLASVVLWYVAAVFAPAESLIDVSGEPRHKIVLRATRPFSTHIFGHRLVTPGAQLLIHRWGLRLVATVSVADQSKRVRLLQDCLLECRKVAQSLPVGVRM
jgi:hypothetical protein